MKNEGGLDKQLSRFVLLRHSLPRESAEQSHWDLMFEAGKALFTLQLAALPENQLHGEPQLLTAKRLVDHRLHYLDYEGEISRTRGNVRRIAVGTYSKSPSIEKPDSTCFTMDSEQLSGDLLIASGDPGHLIQIFVRRWQLRIPAGENPQ